MKKERHRDGKETQDVGEGDGRQWVVFLREVQDLRHSKKDT